MPTLTGTTPPAARVRGNADSGTSRWLPPAHSPLSLRGLGEAMALALPRSDDPRERLAAWLSAEYRADHCLLVDSGTHALQIALRCALARAPGDARGEPIVALPAFSCFDVATAAVGTGARLALYDVDPGSLAPDTPSIRRVLEAGASVIVVAPLFGVPVDWDAIEREAAAFGACVIEDAAQGIGGALHARPIGSLGRLSVLSFGRGKGWTGGLGGALLARRDAASWLEQLAPKLGPVPGALGALARAGVQWAFSRPRLYVLPASLPWLHLGDTIYRDPTLPRALPRFSAGLLMSSRPLVQAEGEVRRANAAVLDEAVASVRQLQRVRPPQGGVPGHLRYPVLVPGGLDGFRDPARARRLGIARGYPANLGQLPAVRERLVPALGPLRWPGADALVQTLVTLPTHSLVSRGDRAAIIELLTDRAG